MKILFPNSRAIIVLFLFGNYPATYFCSSSSSTSSSQQEITQNIDNNPLVFSGGEKITTGDLGRENYYFSGRDLNSDKILFDESVAKSSKVVKTINNYRKSLNSKNRIAPDQFGDENNFVHWATVKKTAPEKPWRTQNNQNIPTSKDFAARIRKKPTQSPGKPKTSLAQPPIFEGDSGIATCDRAEVGVKYCALDFARVKFVYNCRGYALVNLQNLFLLSF